MPTYTYRCGNCSHHFDLHQRFDDADPDTCPNCGLEHRLQRVYKPVGVVFKGSGFYATDNKTRSGSSINGAAPANGSGTAEEKPSKSSDEKPKTRDEGAKKDKPAADSKSDVPPST